MTDPLIINGGHVGEPLARLQRPDGSTVLVWTRADLPAAMQEAIGPLPVFTLGLGGSFEVVRVDGYGHPAEVRYNPAGDEENKALADAFTATVQAWNARAAAIQALVLALMKP